MAVTVSMPVTTPCPACVHQARLARSAMSCFNLITLIYTQSLSSALVDFAILWFYHTTLFHTVLVTSLSGHYYIVITLFLTILVISLSGHCHTVV